MGLRFRKSIKLAPGVRWNISGSGTSWTLGPRGATVSIGKRGAFLNTGIPGTGLAARTRLTGTPQPQRAPRERSAPVTTTVTMSCAISDDGTLLFTDSDGKPVPDDMVEVAKKQNREALLSLIQRKCDEINEQIEALGRLHHDTPAPKPPKFIAPAYPEPMPRPPHQRALSWMDRFFSGRRRKIEEQNREAVGRYEDDVAAWKAAKTKFNRQIAERKVFLETLIYEDTTVMERYLEEKLGEIAWPRETIVAFDIRDAGKRVALDVDLPELEDMPTKLAAVPARGLKLSVKELSASKIQKLYAEHVHGIVFRLVGEVFAALPTVQEIAAAGYSQRRHPATAQLNDDYLLSVRVQRDEWTKIDFAHLADLEVSDALKRFDLRRQMLKTGALKTITPHVPEGG